MYQDKSVCVVVSAYNVKTSISEVISTMPDFVDWIVVVDDCSQDGTYEVVQDYLSRLENKLVLIRHAENQGVGGAVASGFKWARDHSIDVTVNVDGDAQMDPADMPALIAPVISGVADYAKGNRFLSGLAWGSMPRVRYFGNLALSFFTRVASGYWHIGDAQSGYSAINLRMLKLIDWDRTYKRYGRPNDCLVRLNTCDAKIRDVSINPIYHPNIKSRIRYGSFIPKVSFLLLRLFLWRMVVKYIKRGFHPLVLFYGCSLLIGLAAIVLFWALIMQWAVTGHLPAMTACCFGLSLLVSLLCGILAMWLDSRANKHLRA